MFLFPDAEVLSPLLLTFERRDGAFTLIEHPRLVALMKRRGNLDGRLGTLDLVQVVSEHRERCGREILELELKRCIRVPLDERGRVAPGWKYADWPENDREWNLAEAEHEQLTAALWRHHASRPDR